VHAALIEALDNAFDVFIDCAKGWYYERIVAPDGTVVREVSEGLTEHQGRGSARYRQTDRTRESRDDQLMTPES